MELASVSKRHEATRLGGLFYERLIMFEKSLPVINLALMIGLFAVTAANYFGKQNSIKTEQVGNKEEIVAKLIKEQEDIAADRQADIQRWLQRIEEKLDTLRPKNVYPGSSATGSSNN